MDELVRITISTSNVFNTQAEKLSKFYRESKTFTIRHIINLLVNDNQLIKEFVKFYYDVYLGVKKEGVITSSIQKTFYVYPKDFDKFKKIVKKIAKTVPKDSLVSEMIRAAVFYFHKIHIEANQSEVKKLIKKLEKNKKYTIKEFELTSSGIMVKFDI